MIVYSPVVNVVTFEVKIYVIHRSSGVIVVVVTGY